MPKQKNKILVSACLLGLPVRFDGQAKEIKHTIFQHWQEEDRLVPLCPEVSGGLPVPRPAAEIINGSASDVIDGRGYILTEDEEDVSRYFLCGAQHALILCRQQKIGLAILKENSPSCGSTQVYDGRFNGKLVAGQGVTATLLRQNGITVFSEHEIDAADKYVRTLLSVKNYM
ncbi:MAG: DUF523 domain-containing protein [Gammaproteobacteria bacterium]|nr:DUF523 domain-containing protein [Gammaproteobacteria bacterium]